MSMSRRDYEALSRVFGRSKRALKNFKSKTPEEVAAIKNQQYILRALMDDMIDELSANGNFNAQAFRDHVEVITNS